MALSFLADIGNAKFTNFPSMMTEQNIRLAYKIEFIYILFYTIGKALCPVNYLYIEKTFIFEKLT